MNEAIRQFRSEIVLLQETKLSVLSDSTVKEVWGLSAGWVCRESVEASGGILVMWNGKSFITRDQWVGSYSVSVLLEDMGSKVI